MKTNPAGIIAIASLLVILISCSKEDDAMTQKTMLLCEREWKFEAHGLDENNDGLIATSENRMLACEQDDIYQFNTNCTGVFTSGSMHCSVDEELSIDFNWRFLNRGTQLAVFAAPEMINRLDENILEVYYMDEDSVGHPVKYIRRFKH